MLLTQAYTRTHDARFLTILATFMMSTGNNQGAFQLLNQHLDPQRPDINLVLLMTEALVEQNELALAKEYIDYASQLGASLPKINNLRQRLHLRQSAPPSSLDAHNSPLDSTQPQQIQNSPLEYVSDDTIADDATEFVARTVVAKDNLTSALNTTALESVSTHVMDAEPGLSPTRSVPNPVHHAPTAVMTDHAHDDPTMAFIKSPSIPELSNLEPPQDPTLEERYDLSSIQDSTSIYETAEQDETDFVSLSPNSASSYLLEDVYTPMADEEQVSQSQFRRAHFGTEEQVHKPSDLSLDLPEPPRKADPAPSFGARPADKLPHIPQAANPPSYSLFSEPSEVSSQRPLPTYDVRPSQVQRQPQPPQATPAPSQPRYNAPPTAQVHHPTPEPTPVPVALPEALHDTGKPPVALILSIIAALVVVALGLSISADYMLAKKLKQNISDAITLADTGTYENNLKALSALEQNSTLTPFLGDWITPIHRALSSFIPVYQAPLLQDASLTQAAYRAAFIEWHFEARDTRNAAQKIEQAKELDSNPQQIVLAEVYQSLDHDPVKALALISPHYSKSPQDLDLALAMAFAAYPSNKLTLGSDIVNMTRTLPKQSEATNLLLLKAMSLYRDPDAYTQIQDLLSLETTTHTTELHLLNTAQNTIFMDGLKESNDAIQSAIEQAPPTWHNCYKARLYHAQSRVLLAEQDMEKTQQPLEQATKLCPSSLMISRDLITHMINTGHYDSAHTLINTLKNSSPNALLEFHEATLAMHTGNPSKLNEALQPLVEKNLPLALNLQAHHHLLFYQYEQAQTLFEQSSKIDAQGGTPQAYAHMISALNAPDTTEEHTKAIKKLRADNPRYTIEIKLIHAELQRQLAPLESSKQSMQKQFQAAQRELMDVVANMPYEAPTRFTLCDLYISLDDTEKATNACKQASKQNPNYLPGKITLAKLSLVEGNPQQAKSILLPLDVKHPDYLPLARILISAYLNQGDLGAASQRLEKLSQLYPDNPITHLLLGRLAFARGRYKDAIQHLKPVAQNYKAMAEAQLFLAYAQVRMGKLDGTDNTIKSYLSHPTLKSYAWLALGELRRRQDRFNDAEENLQKAADLFADATVSNWFRIEVYMQRALAWQSHHGWQHPKVRMYLEKARAFDEDSHADLNYLLGALEMGQKKADKEQALVYFNKALSIFPNHCPSINALIELEQESFQDRKLSTMHNLSCKD